MGLRLGLKSLVTLGSGDSIWSVTRLLRASLRREESEDMFGVLSCFVLAFNKRIQIKFVCNNQGCVLDEQLYWRLAKDSTGQNGSFKRSKCTQAAARAPFGTGLTR